MAVVFDEVVGTVESDRPAVEEAEETEEDEEAAPSLGHIRRELQRLKLREARLYAD